MRKNRPARANVLITGCTGFVGKVVLAELLRRKEELGVERALVLIRDRRGKTSEQRFKEEVRSSACFSKLPAGWADACEVVPGDMSVAGLGLTPEERADLVSRVTHVIHCAASVEFDLPLTQAAALNCTGALNVLELARSCSKLVSMVDVSTAYVTPHSGAIEPLEERLVELNVDAEETYRAILDGSVDERALLKKTGHPNTYTLTKCLAELLLAKRRGNVPLSIVRPSIISSCWKHPFPGWIDSRAALAAYLCVYASGYMRVLNGNDDALVDVVPCDEVARKILAASFAPRRAKGKARELEIRFAVSGLERALSVKLITSFGSRFFAGRPLAAMPRVRYSGSRDWRYLLMDVIYQRVPTQLGLALLKLKDDPRAESAANAVQRLEEYSDLFAYFTHRTFDFRASEPISDPGHTPEAYVRRIYQGTYRHLLKGSENERQAVLAGRRADRRRSDLAWATGIQGSSNETIRMMGLLLRKGLRRCTDQITFDRASFEAALGGAPGGARQVTPKGVPMGTQSDELLVIVPSHRSYLDFLLCSYLFFAQPDLGVPVPHIAATQDFGKIPIVGAILRRSRAFFLQRGVGREDPTLSREIARIVSAGEPLEFFVEGKRSRSRRFVAPRRGVLRALQATGRSFRILPVALSYDRVPEQSAMSAELMGHPKRREGLRPLLRWGLQLLRGEVDLGRIHLHCGKPIRLDPGTDVHEASRAIMAELQAGTATSAYHLRTFVERSPVEGISVEWLSGAIRRRGGTVLESPLRAEAKPHPGEELSLRNHWIHCFYDEAERIYRGNPAVLAHIASNRYVPAGEARAPRDRRVRALVRALFAPIRVSYAASAQELAAIAGNAGRGITAGGILTRRPEACLPDIEDALSDLARRGLAHSPDGKHFRPADVSELERYAKRCLRDAPELKPAESSSSLRRRIAPSLPAAARILQ